MTDFFALLSPSELALSLAVVALAGVIKGMVGFAMPMISIAGLSTFLPPDIALAGLILPTLVTNGVQALRQGLGEALASLRRFGVFLSAGGVFLLASAQLFRVLPENALYLLIGIPVVVLSLIMLAGPRLHMPRQHLVADIALGSAAGFVGGVSGVWGPPTVIYLTAMSTPKQEQLRIQGVIYGLGAVLLLLAHTGSGVVRGETLPFSVVLVIPAMLGMWIGLRLHDRIDQVTFRRATLLVLLLAGLNLVRRGLLG